MPFCPNCGYEYRPEIAVCTECGSEQTDSSPQPAEPNALHLVFDACLKTMMISVIAVGALFLTWVVPAHLLASLNLNVFDERPLVGFFLVLTLLVVGILGYRFFRPVPVCLGWVFTGMLLWIYNNTLLVSDESLGSGERILLPSALVHLVLLPSVGAAAMLSGMRFRHRRRWWLLVLPFVWAAAVVGIITFMEHCGIRYYPG